jgi:hypothetical protein
MPLESAHGGDCFCAWAFPEGPWARERDLRVLYIRAQVPSRPSSMCRCFSAVENKAEDEIRTSFQAYLSLQIAVLVRGNVDGGQTAPAALVESLRGKSCWIER